MWIYHVLFIHSSINFFSTFMALFLCDCALGIWFEFRYLTPRKISKQPSVQDENEGEERYVSKSPFMLLEGAAFKAECREPFFVFVLFCVLKLLRISLAVWWLRVCHPMQELWVQSLVMRELRFPPTCLTAKKPKHKTEAIL